MVLLSDVGFQPFGWYVRSGALGEDLAERRGDNVRDVGEAAFDAIKLALVVIKLRQHAESEPPTDATLTPEECGRVIQAMQLLKEGPG